MLHHAKAELQLPLVWLGRYHLLEMITQTNTVDLQRQIVVHCEQLPGQLLQTPGLNTRE